jgi:hypothetical protein
VKVAKAAREGQEALARTLVSSWQATEAGLDLLLARAKLGPPHARERHGARVRLPGGQRLGPPDRRVCVGELDRLAGRQPALDAHAADKLVE